MRRSLFFTFVTLLAVLTLAGCLAGGRHLVQVTPLPARSEPVAQSAAAVVRPSPTLTHTATPAAAPQETTPTPTPWQTDLPEGNARTIALATDAAFQPTPRSPVAFDSSPVGITFEEFYDGYDIRSGLILSDKLVSLDGQPVVMEGYMAPPLKANLDFFVLTRVRLAICPFCSSDADWPNDIALIYMPEEAMLTSTQSPVRVTGQMEVGSSLDYESGMVSLVRIYADEVEVLQ